MSNVNNTQGVMGMAAKWDLGPTKSIQLLFAIMNLELSESSKNQAKSYMDKIAKSQDEQKKVATLIQEARQAQTDAKTSGKATSEPEGLREYMDENSLAYDKTVPKGATVPDKLHDKDEWEVAIKSLQAHQEQIGTNTQQLMVLVQDFIGQYNAYLQGANKAITDANQTLQSIIGR